MMRFFGWTLFLMILSPSCQSNKIDPKFILGTWKNLTLKVKMTSYKQSDTSKWLIAENGQWERVLKIKPIETTYFEDGTFKSEYRSLDNKLLGTEEGKWVLKNDSLKLISSNYNYTYKLHPAVDSIRFVAFVDWDNDGERDDLYDGWQVRVDHE